MELGAERIKLDPERMSAQLGTIVREIHAALSTIGALSGPLILAQSTLPAATASLSEVSSMTEDASQSILSLIEEQLEIQKNIGEMIRRGPGTLTSYEAALLESLVFQDQQSTLRVMGALGFQDLVQQNLSKIALSIQIVENKLLEILMLLQWENGSGTLPEAKKLLDELYRTRVGDPSRQRLVDEILKESGV